MPIREVISTLYFPKIWLSIILAAAKLYYQKIGNKSLYLVCWLPVR
jgi:hypothetical protein